MTLMDGIVTAMVDCLMDAATGDTHRVTVSESGYLFAGYASSFCWNQLHVSAILGAWLCDLKTRRQENREPGCNGEAP